MREALHLTLIWGVWILIPIITDGISTLWNILTLVVHRRIPLEVDPLLPISVSIVIPAYNEALNINRCLLSLQAQTYPHNLMEIVVVDDGSSDNTVNQVLRYMGTSPIPEGLQTTGFAIYAPRFGGVLNIVRRKRDNNALHGKAAAVNAGIDLISGDLIFSIDADVVLAPDAIEKTVRAFAGNPEMVAATGHLIIDSYLATEATHHEKTVIDENGIPISSEMNASERALTAFQFIEYLNAFHLGRSAESITDTMFTLSGACAVFKRDILLNVGKFSGRTVSEDTDVTMAVHKLGEKQIGYLRDTHIHLAPTLSWADLYSQRVRWQRGALEVAAMYYHTATEIPQRRKRLFWNIALPLRLQVDHTLAIPRMIWTFVIFTLPMFGYSWSVIRDAFVLLFLFYTVVNIFRVLAAYAVSIPPEKVFVRRYLGYIAAFPLYNIFLYWTRMSGVLTTMTKDASWRIDNKLLRSLEHGKPFLSLAQKVNTVINSLFGHLR